METSDKLWCDLRTDAERMEFLKSSRAVETGIIAPAIVNDVIDLLKFRIDFAVIYGGKDKDDV